jgi:hypothetical protein
LTDEELDQLTEEMCRAIDEGIEKDGPAKRKGRRKPGVG